MTIGLTSEQLVSAYFESLKSGRARLKGEMEAIKDGESPDESEYLLQMEQEFPEFSVLEAWNRIIEIEALMDAIVANNNALAKAIPHVES